LKAFSKLSDAARNSSRETLYHFWGSAGRDPGKSAASIDMVLGVRKPGNSAQPCGLPCFMVITITLTSIATLRVHE